MRFFIIVIILLTATMPLKAKIDTIPEYKVEKINKNRYQGTLGIVLGTDIGGAIPFPFSNLPKPFNAYPQVKANIGAQLSFSLVKNWGLGIDLYYKGMGMRANARVKNQRFRMDGGDMYFTGSASMNMDFNILEIPLYAKYQFNAFHRIVFGGYYSHVFSAYFETNPQKGFIGSTPNIADITDMGNIEMDFTPFMDNWDWGLLVGYERRLNSSLNFGLRLSMGFKDIFKTTEKYFEYNMLHMRGSVTLCYNILKTSTLIKNRKKIGF